MLSVPLRRTAAAAIGLAGLLHLVLVPEYLGEAWPLGASFLISAAVTGWVAVALWRSDSRPAWQLGALTSAGIVLGFLLSRTVGLLGYRSADWAEGIPSLVAELLFLGLAAAALRPARIEPAIAAPQSSRR